VPLAVTSVLDLANIADVDLRRLILSRHVPSDPASNSIGPNRNLDMQHITGSCPDRAWTALSATREPVLYTARVGGGITQHVDGMRSISSLRRLKIF
jgi:hypothetical protein